MSQDIRAPQWSRPASVEIGEVPLEGVPDVSWLPKFPDFPARAAPRVAHFQAYASNLFPIPALLSWHPTFDDFAARAAPRAAWFQAYASNEEPIPALLSWHPTFDDFARRAARTAEYQAYASNLFPIPALLSWHPTFDDFAARAAPRAAWFQAYAANIFPIPPLLSWHPTFDDFARASARAAEYPFLAYNPSRDVPEVNLSWHPTFDDFARAALRTAEYQFIARPVAPVAKEGAATIVIHTPDEIPVGAETRFSVEYDVDGVPVPFDAPPTLRIYHLDLVTGLEVTDLPAAPMTQYGLAPAYHTSWTPVAKGVYILEVRGVYLLVNVIAVLPVTVRPKFDPIGLAIDDVLVARNGDVPT